MNQDESTADVVDSQARSNEDTRTRAAPSPSKREIVHAELTRRAATDIGDGASALGYAFEWIASGNTLTKLADELSAGLGIPVSRETVRRALAIGEDDQRVERRLREARAEGASVLADEAREIVDAVPEDRDAIAKAKLRSDVRQWLAGKWNRDQYGEQKPSGIQISIGQLHIDALRQSARIVNPHQPNPAIAPAVDAVVLSIADASESAPNDEEFTDD